MHAEDRYRPVARPYLRRFEYRYTDHVFDKLQIIDIARRVRALARQGRGH